VPELVGARNRGRDRRDTQASPDLGAEEAACAVCEVFFRARGAVGKHLRHGAEAQWLHQTQAPAPSHAAVRFSSAHATRPNSVRCIDYKGDFPIGRSRCYPLTITDAYSRFVIACIALTSTETTPARRALERVFDEYGLADAIRSDNRSPFAARGLGGLSRLSVWWHELGIRHERIQPAHPEQNGQHERMHFDLERVLELGPPTSLAAAQRLFDKYRCELCFERPHESLGMRTPSDFYEASRRRLPEPTWDATSSTARTARSCASRSLGTHAAIAAVSS
jgi:transposase InsO family protein